MVSRSQSEFLEPYRTIRADGNAEVVIQRSRFIGLVRPVASEEEAMLYIEETRRTYHDARHVCYAWRVGAPPKTSERFFDAGEPGRTAGYPMWQLLQGEELFNLVVVAIRYFGGIKLGIGGLARAYRDTARAALDATEVITVFPETRLKIRVPYSIAGKLDYQLEMLPQVRVVEKDFAQDILYVLAIQKQEFTSVRESLAELLQCDPDTLTGD